MLSLSVAELPRLLRCNRIGFEESMKSETNIPSVTIGARFLIFAWHRPDLVYQCDACDLALFLELRLFPFPLRPLVIAPHSSPRLLLP